MCLGCGKNHPLDDQAGMFLSEAIDLQQPPSFRHSVYHMVYSDVYYLVYTDVNHVVNTDVLKWVNPVVCNLVNTVVHKLV